MMHASVTARRMLGACLALGVLATAASAATINVDSFESYTNNTPALELLSANGWSATDADLSSVIASNYTYTATTFPISAAHTKVLNLNTEGETLTNEVGAVGGVVYVDTMVQFVNSDEDPAALTNDTRDTSIQAAVYVNATSNLVVLAGGIDASSPYSGLTDADFAVTATKVDPDAWYRLTITMDYDSGDVEDLFDRAFFTVRLNGVAITGDQAYDAPFNGATPTASGTGIWFVAANLVSSDSEQMNSVGLQGTGMVDDFLVTTTAPTYEAGGPVGYFTIISVVSGNGSADPSGSASIEVGTAGTLVDYDADLYYEIGSFETDGSSVPAAVGQTSYAYSVAGAADEVYSNNVVFVASVDSTGAPLYWLGGYGLDGSDPDPDSDLRDNFAEWLASTNPNVNDAFEITEVGIDGSGKPYVKWLGEIRDGNLPPFTVEGVDAMGDTWDLVDGAVAYAGGTYTWTGDDAAAAYKFFRVVGSDGL